MSTSVSSLIGRLVGRLGNVNLDLFDSVDIELIFYIALVLTEPIQTNKMLCHKCNGCHVVPQNHSHQLSIQCINWEESYEKALTNYSAS
jgi:hypothetical protein